jgi:uncharacterized protein YfeS
MDITILHRTYNCYGGCIVFSPVADLLSLRLGEYGEAVQSIDILAWLRIVDCDLYTDVENMFHRDFYTYIATLPKTTFRRKKKCLDLEFVSKAITAEDSESYQLSVEKCNRALADIAAALPLLGTRLKKNDHFDFATFLADAQRILGKPFTSEAEIRQIEEDAKDKREAELATKPWWEGDEIDWGKYHPKTREILDDPFYWDRDDDFAPHGNDTGADLLDDYCKWVRRHPHDSPLTFLNRLMKVWDFAPVDWEVTDEAEVRELEARMPMELHVCNQAMVALAFAVIKMCGTCPKDVVDLAMKAIERDGYDFMEKSRDENCKRQHREALAKMKAKLESM